ncbi:methylamine utilization protein [Psychromonas ossibalaenae]|uniref:methylamine utilization protein n=1 Tax=Psychromonas ossibalaenae TaxID=444922 RepID=UPI00037CD2CF|nr:methylamine utilization protein [Psychromonas ossibalaenae]
MFFNRSLKLLSKVLTVFFCFTVGGPVEAAVLKIQAIDQQNKPVENAVITATPLFSKVEIVKQTKIIDQINKEYVPRVVIISKGSSVKFPNKDNIRHHVYSFSKAKQFELPLYEGSTAPPVEFNSEGTVTLGCNIHDWMRGYVYISETPFAALTDKKGAAVIQELTEETYRVDFWHPRLKKTLISREIKLQQDSIETVKIRLQLKQLIKKRQKMKTRFGRYSD